MQTTLKAKNGRGCGDRSEGSPYACCGFHKNGTPVELFVIDPAILWLGEFQRGVKILPRYPVSANSVNDLVIFVGEEFYPSPWDFVEEVRRFGASRKLPQNLPFENLTPGDSRMVFVHSKTIPNFAYTADRARPYYGCSCFWQIDGTFDKSTWSKAKAGYHYPDPKPCTHALKDLAFLVHDSADLLSAFYPEERGEFYSVNMPSFSYEAKYPIKPTSPAVIGNKNWQVGIFMALPITHIEYKNTPDRSKNNAEAVGFQTVTLDY